MLEYYDSMLNNRHTVETGQHFSLISHASYSYSKTEA